MKTKQAKPLFTPQEVLVCYSVALPNSAPSHGSIHITMTAEARTPTVTADLIPATIEEIMRHLAKGGYGKPKTIGVSCIYKLRSSGLSRDLLISYFRQTQAHGVASYRTHVHHVPAGELVTYQSIIKLVERLAGQSAGWAVTGIQELDRA